MIWQSDGASRRVWQVMEVDDHSSWWSDLGASQHLDHLNTIVNGAVFISKALVQGISVLVHCSDGWDRTAQMVTLAQLMVDPYYRTIKGFQVG